jgi:hypothetical protein
VELREEELPPAPPPLREEEPRRAEFESGGGAGGSGTQPALRPCSFAAVLLSEVLKAVQRRRCQAIAILRSRLRRTKDQKRPATKKQTPKSAKRSKKSNKAGKKASKPKKVSAAGSETRDYKTSGAPSTMGNFLGKARLQRGGSEHAIHEATQCVLQNGFMNPSSGGGSGGSTSTM